MDNNHIIELIPEYLDGTLEETQRKKVETHLKKCDSCTKEMVELKKLFNAFRKDEIAQPSSDLKVNFLKQLEEEKRTTSKIVSLEPKATAQKKPWVMNFMKIAASVALLIGAFFTGKFQSEENSNEEIALLTEEKLEFKQTAMLSLMENRSASKRIQGVNFIEEFANPDEAIVKALADRMLYDENTNVRAAAVEVLSKYTSSESIKNTFIKALKIEKDPGIQIEIIQTLGKMQEKKAVAPMRELLQKEETQPFVKKQIESLLPNII